MSHKDLKIVFFGTSDFAQSILDILLEAGITVCAVVTRPDKPTGRNLKLTPSIVKQYIIDKQLSIPVYTPVKSSTAEFAEILQALQPDLFVIAAYGEIIKPLILSLPRLGSINVHPSLLPRYRGPSPLQSALLNGDAMTGVCIIDVAEKMDAGAIYGRKVFDIDPKDNFSLLQMKALAHTKNLLIDVIQDIHNSTAQPEPQDDAQATYCKKITHEDEKIDWSSSLESIHNKIRALSEKPCAWSYIKVGDDVKRVKIYESELEELNDGDIEPNGKKFIYVKRGPQVLKIISLQPEGKKRLKSHEWLAGIRESYSFF